MKPSRASASERRAVTIKEVAARAGVSTASVSRVLAGMDGAGPDVRRRVLKAVRELDYQPNRLARSLRMRQRRLIGVILPDLQNPFFTSVVHGAEEVFWREGYTLLLCHSGSLAERERSHFGVLRGEGAAGMILIPGNAPEADYAPLVSWRMPIVAVDRAPRGLSIDQVQVTNREGAREAVRHFIRLGYQTIALINGPEIHDVSRERLAGFQEALREAGLACLDRYVAQGDFRQDSGQRAMAELLDLPEPPRAVLIANNLMTLGALRTIYERNLRIAQDLALICFDDMPWAISLRPPLTAIAQPAEELGQAAAHLLLESMRNPERTVRQVTLRTRLVIRASCGAASAPPFQNSPLIDHSLTSTMESVP